MVTPASRLSHLRISAGFKTATEAAKHLGVATVTYQHHESGTRDVSRKAAARYASFFGVQPGQILYGDTAVTTAFVPIIGGVMAGGIVVGRMSCPGAPPESISAPNIFDSATRALIVYGGDLSPSYRVGDILFFSELKTLDVAATGGRRCVVETTEHDRLIGDCNVEKENVVTLVTYDGMQPRRGLKLRAASPISWVNFGGFPQG